MIKQIDQFQPERILVIANSGQGKTYWTSNYVLDKIKKQQFECPRIIIISKTFRGDSSMQKLWKYCQSKYKMFLEDNCFDDLQQGGEFLKELFDTQKEMKDGGQTINQWCVILDDLIGDKYLYSQDFISLCSLCRHYGITLITLLQETKSLSPKVLGQSSMLVIGRLSNEDRLEDLLKEFSQGSGQDKKSRRNNMMKIFEIALDKGRFLIIKPHVLLGKGKLFTDTFEELDSQLIS